MSHTQGTDRDEMREALRQALVQAGMLAGEPLPPDIGQAVLTLVPREEGLAAKDIPVDSLINKVVMIRDRLRVSEQRINASDALGAATKLELQGRITAVQQVLVGLAALLAAPPDSAKDETP